MENITPTKKHIGRKIAKIREFKGMKQEALALALNVSQQTVSKMENEETISEDRLKEVAEALGVTPQAIKDFDEDKVIYNINNIQNNTNTVSENTFEQPAFIGQFGQQFNPLDKIVELYERLVECEREKNELLKKTQG